MKYPDHTALVIQLELNAQRINEKDPILIPPRFAQFLGIG